MLRVAELIRHAVAEILSRGGLNDPILDTQVVTVPRVRMSPRSQARDDFRYAARPRFQPGSCGGT